MTVDSEKLNDAAAENAGRRKIIKNIVGGVTTLAAYNLLPAKWGVPLVESVILPAHAATSGTSMHDPCSITWTEFIDIGDLANASMRFQVTGYVSPPTGGVSIHIVVTPENSAGPSVAVDTTTQSDGTYSAYVDLTFSWLTQLHINAVTTGTNVSGSANCSYLLAAAPD